VKYAVFFIALAVGVPVLTVLAVLSGRLRGWLLTALIFSTALGDRASLSFAYIKGYRGPDRSLGISLTDLLAWALVIALVLRFPRRLCWVPYNSICMLVLFGVGCIATWVAPMPFWGSFALVKWLRVYVVFWCVTNCLRAGVEYKYVWMGILAVGALVTALALEQKFVGGIYRIHGPFDHSNIVPLYLNMVMPALLLWGLCDKSLSKWQVVASVGTALGMVFSVGATFSRAGTGLALAGVLFALLVANIRARSSRVVVVSLMVLLGMFGGGILAAGALLNRIESAPTESLETRRQFNAAAAAMLKEHFLGVGLNNFSRALELRLERDDTNMELLGEKMEEDQQPGFCHHIYWLTAAETGYLGLAALLLVIGRFLWLTGVYAWRSTSLESLLLSGFFVGFCALHLSGFFEWVLRTAPVLYLLAISSGVCVAFAGTVKNQLRPT
jgi:hypothetical protein